MGNGRGFRSSSFSTGLVSVPGVAEPVLPSGGAGASAVLFSRVSAVSVSEAAPAVRVAGSDGRAATGGRETRGFSTIAADVSPE